MLSTASLNQPAVHCVALAALLHLVFIFAAMGVRLKSHFENPEEWVHRFRVKSVRKEKPLSVSPILPAVGAARAVKRTGLGATDVKDISLREIVKAAPRAALQEPEFAVTRLEAGESRVMSGSNWRRLVTDSEERSLRDSVKLVTRRTDTLSPASAKTRPAAAQAVSLGNLLSALQRPIAEPGLEAPRNVAIDPEEGMPGFTPGAFRTSGAAESAVDARVGEAKADITGFEALDAFLDVEVVTYRNPRGDDRYFMVRIFPKKNAGPSRVLPKEILFAIDCSLSISRERLEEFKRGISYCLSHLNEGDRFNLVAFKDEVSFFSVQSIPPSADAIRRAERFVMGLEPSRRTDMVAAIRRLVEKPIAHEPSNIFLLSDGRPTHGIVDARELLASITRLNQKTRPIFVFSGGAKVNRYLLDFIAYQNRAWSEYVKKRQDIDRALGSFYEKVRDPIFLHLRYRLSGVEENEVFPKWLPDFYRNAEFTVYGTWSEDEDVFSMQLLGDVDGKTRELVFQRSLKDARPGTEDVMRGWAFNKIYHLINEVTRQGNRPELLNEIEQLSRRYGIQTPYSPELRNID